jgi:hypothetical protein
VTTAQAFDLTHVFNKTIASRVGHHESWFLSFGITRPVRGRRFG